MDPYEPHRVWFTIRSKGTHKAPLQLGSIRFQTTNKACAAQLTAVSPPSLNTPVWASQTACAHWVWAPAIAPRHRTGRAGVAPASLLYADDCTAEQAFRVPPQCFSYTFNSEACPALCCLLLMSVLQCHTEPASRPRSRCTTSYCGQPLCTIPYRLHYIVSIGMLGGSAPLRAKSCRATDSGHDLDADVKGCISDENDVLCRARSLASQAAT